MARKNPAPATRRNNGLRNVGHYYSVTYEYLDAYTIALDLARIVAGIRVDRMAVAVGGSMDCGQDKSRQSAAMLF